MSKLYSASEIGKMLDLTSDTIKNWERMNLIPEASRIGLQRKRVWSEWKLQRILEFAKDNGYTIHSWLIPAELRGD